MIIFSPENSIAEKWEMCKEFVTIYKEFVAIAHECFIWLLGGCV